MKITIAGGSGLLGNALLSEFRKAGHEIIILSRREKPSSAGIRYVKWDIQSGDLDVQAIEGSDLIINLAGANLNERNWSAAYKKEIIDSRVLSCRLLQNKMQELKQKPKLYLVANAVGYYGNRGQEWLNEASGPGKGFMSEVCIAWQEEAMKNAAADRTIVMRLGVVFAKESGAFPELLRPLKFGAKVSLGKGQQMLSWIHIRDVLGIIQHLIAHEEMKGIYNVVSPDVKPMKEVINSIARGKGGLALPIPAPEFALRMVLGEKADMILDSQACSAEKILKAGYRFQFAKLDEAVKDLLS